MILCLDIGNTNIKIGLFEQNKLLHAWRLASDLNKTADEYGVALMQLISSNNIDIKKITGSALSSVIPQLNYTISHMLDYYFYTKPIVIGPGVKTGLNLMYENPREVGSDRIVNSVCAYKTYGGPLIVVDFGTATTFNAISSDGKFLGGCICPGVKTSIESLVNSASKLPRIELKKPKSIIGKNTVTNMQSGIIFGVVGQVKHIIELLREEMGEPNAKVVATGGLSELVQSEGLIDIFDRKLSLFGLKMVYDMNSNG